MSNKPKRETWGPRTSWVLAGAWHPEGECSGQKLETLASITVLVGRCESGLLDAPSSLQLSLFLLDGLVSSSQVEALAKIGPGAWTNIIIEMC